MTTRLRPLLPYMLLTCCALFWAGNFIVGRALRGQIPPLALTFWRWAVAMIFLLPFSIGQLSTQRSLVRAHWRLIFALAITGVAGFQACVYLALTTTTAINALLFLSTAPVVIVIISHLMHGDRISRQQAVGIAVSLIGAVVLIAQGDLQHITSLHLNRGDVLMLVAVLLWAIYSILLRRRPRTMSQLTLLGSTVIAGLLIIVPIFVWRMTLGEVGTYSLMNLLGIIYIGLFASVLAFLFWNRGVAEIGPNQAGLFLHLMPVFGAILSTLFLGESLAAYHLIGAALVFTGIALTTLRR